MRLRASIHFNAPSASADDPELGLHLAGLRRESTLDLIEHTRDVLPKNAFDPALVLSVEIGKTIERQEIGGHPQRAGLHVPLEHAETARFLGERQEFFAVRHERRKALLIRVLVFLLQG